MKVAYVLIALLVYIALTGAIAGLATRHYFPELSEVHRGLLCGVLTFVPALMFFWEITK